MLNIEILDRSSLPLYLLLVKPGMRQFVGDSHEKDGLLLMGASFWGEPAGVAVVFPGDTVATLLDLYVLPSYRQAGIGSRLLAGVEEQLALAGAPRIQTVYRPDEHTPNFERLLTAQGWATPTLRSQVRWTRCAVAFSPWVSRYRFRPPYELFTWTELTEAERSRVAQRGADGWYAPDLSPFHRANVAWDAESSVGLRCSGEVVGWCLTVREKQDQMLVEILFVDPPLQRLGRGFMLVGEVIRRYCASGGDYAYWRVSPDNEPMLRWSRNAFADGGLVDQYDEWYTGKTLIS